MENQYNQLVKIGEKTLGVGHPSYIIAEIGANFDGDIEKAKKMCLAAKEAGADCAKFQSFISEKIVSAKGFEMMTLKGVHGSWGRPINEVFKDAEFPREWHKEVAEYCKSIDIHFSTSPYDIEAVDLCMELDVPFIKIGSGEITWLEMIELIASKQKPVILATGDATMSEIDEALRTIDKTGNKNVVLLQCITNYPSLIESANINVLKNYQTSFNILTGYSDHSPGPVVALASIALNGVVIEKHFTLDKTDEGPDHPHSMDVNEFKVMVDYIRQLEQALGSSRKLVVKEEEETVYVQRRCLYTNREIKEGEEIGIDDIVVLRPALGILPKYKDVVIGKIARKTIPANTPIFWNQF